MFYLWFKRIFDIILSFIGLIVFLPLFLIIIILIKLDSKGPVFFKQKRFGRYKKYFYMYKFRTMHIDSPNNTPTHMLKNPEQWITKIGKFLRKTSLDELPQIINILKGDMSIIGPRPALWNQYDLVEERDKYNVYKLFPGLTGYAQINGRDKLPLAEKAKFDGYYAKHISLWLDIKIFLGTIIRIFNSDGVIEGDAYNWEEKKNQKDKTL